jgi:tetratricopeptide (TPR) repeat protein
MYLTHLDDEGNDSPAILIENATAANRAVNIPEFVNIAPDGLRKIDGPTLEYTRLVDSAMYFRKKGQYEESIAKWKKVLEISADDALAHNSLGLLLLMTGRPKEAAPHLQKAKEMRLTGAR